MRRFIIVLEGHRTLTIVVLAILGGIFATWLLPRHMPELPFDYSIYMQGARMIRAGQSPYVTLPFWYPLPIVLFTIVPWSFLPDTFFWAFVFIPLGLLHLHFGKRTPLVWLFYPLLINVAYGQAEGWLLLPMVWLLKDTPINSSFAMMAMLFKPTYAMLLAPYRVIEWLIARAWKNLAWLAGLTVLMFGAAFVVDPQWVAQWLGAIMRRGSSPGLIARNITMWAFIERGGLWYIPLALFLLALILLAIPALKKRETRGEVLVALSLFIFPNGLYPVSTMMVLPFVETRAEIIALVGASWLIAFTEIFTGDFGGYYQSLVLFALGLRQLRARRQNGLAA